MTGSPVSYFEHKPANQPGQDPNLTNTDSYKYAAMPEHSLFKPTIAYLTLFDSGCLSFRIGHCSRHAFMGGFGLAFTIRYKRKLQSTGLSLQVYILA